MEAEGDLSSYSDADTVSGYAQEALQWSNEKGILLGVSETRLAPLSSATRAQFATMLMRFSALVGE